MSVCPKCGKEIFEGEAVVVNTELRSCHYHCPEKIKPDKYNVPHPICPVNLYFEGDEDKCDVSKCNFDTETRSCTEACKINVEEKDKWIVMQENLRLGHRGQIIITTKERIAKNQPPIAKDIVDETTAHHICKCINEQNKS